MLAHSGAYSLAHLGLRMQICAHAGVRFKFWTALSPKTLISKADAEAAEATRATIPARTFMVEICCEKRGSVSEKVPKGSQSETTRTVNHAHQNAHLFSIKGCMYLIPPRGPKFTSAIKPL